MARLKDKSRIQRSRKTLPANFFSQKEKMKNDDLEKAANFAKIAKVTRIFLVIQKDWVTNITKKQE